MSPREPLAFLFLFVPFVSADAGWMQNLLSSWATTGDCNDAAMCGKCGVIGAVASLDSSEVGQIQACGRNQTHLFDRSQTLFEIASNTKVFTTLLLQQLVDSVGTAFSMDDTLQQFLPRDSNFACAATGGITLHQLGSHTSGLPKVPSNLPSNDPLNNPYTNYTQEELWHYLTNLPCCGPQMQREKCLGPKGVYLYSNLGVGLLGHLMEERTDVQFEKLLLQYQLYPLGMNSTRINLTAQEWAQRVAPGHVRGTGEVTERRQPYGVLKGNGALHSSVDDMITFLRAAMVNPQHNSTALQKAFVEIRSPVASDLDGAGAGTSDLGWFTAFSHLDTVYWKSGGTRGYGSFMCYNLQTRRVAVALENCGNCGSKAVHELALGLLEGPPPVRQWYAARKEELQPFIGDYVFPRGVGIALEETPSVVPVSVKVSAGSCNEDTSALCLRLQFNDTVFEEKAKEMDVRPFYSARITSYPASALAFARDSAPGPMMWEAYFLHSLDSQPAQASQLVLHVSGIDRFAHRMAAETREPSSKWV